MAADVITLREAVPRHADLLLDTCVLILAERLPTLHGIRSSLHASVVSLWEFLHGTAGSVLSRDDSRAREKWLGRRQIRTVDLSKHQSASFRAILKLSSSPPDLADCLLAAEAVCRGWPLVTSNVRDFVGVDQLCIVNVGT